MVPVGVEVWLGTPSCGTRWVPRGIRVLILGSSGRGRPRLYPASVFPTPKLYLSPLLGEEQHRVYQHLVGMAEWMVQIGRFDILLPVTCLNRLSVAPMESHIKRLVDIFGYLQKSTGRWKVWLSFQRI